MFIIGEKETELQMLAKPLELSALIKFTWLYFPHRSSKLFPFKNSKDLNYDPVELWKHSLGAAVASSTIAELTNHCPRQRAYSCGLVHDIGVARLQIHPESFCEDVGDALYDEVTFLEVEEKKNSPTHDRVGQIV